MSVVSRDVGQGVRLVSRSEDGARWLEKDLGDGTVDRHYLDGPIRTSSAMLPMTLSTTTAAPTAKSTAAKPAAKRQSRGVPIRRMGGDPCDVEVRISDSVIDTISRSMMWETGVDGLEAG